MTLNPNIILQGQLTNPIAAAAHGAQTGQMINDFQQTNALRDIYKQHGPGIMAGDQNALNALASHDPQAAMGVQSVSLGLDQKRQNMAHADQRMAMLSREEQRGIEAHLASMSAADRAAEAQRLEGLLSGAAHFYSTGDEQGYNDYLARNNIDPTNPEYSFSSYPAAAARYGEVLSTLTKFNEMNASPDPMDEIALQRAEIGLETDRARLDQLNNPTPDPNEVFGNASDLRKEWSGNASVKAFAEQSAAFGRIQASANDPSPAGDLALIFNFMKVLDPGSVVRESEFATAAQASAWLQESEQAGFTVPRPIANAIRGMANGQRLSREQRGDFVGRAAALYGNAEMQYNSLADQFTEIANRNGIRPEDAIIDYRYADGSSASPERLIFNPTTGGFD